MEQTAPDSPVENIEPAARPLPTLSYNARLGPTCMMWAIFLGLGFFIGVIIIWGISHLDTIVQ